MKILTNLYWLLVPQRKQSIYDPAKLLIYVADGSILAGGLADRFRGIVSLYKVSKDIGVDFKIHMIIPFTLDFFLQPNLHNWRLDTLQEVFIYDKESIVYTQWSGKNSPRIQYKEIVKQLAKYFKSHQYIRCTTNINVADEEYGLLFEELFKPSAVLDQAIQHHLKELGKDYVAVTYRFQQLLGDFKEANFPILSESERTNLLKSCESKLLEIYRKEKCSKLLLTSDSISFLNEMSKYPFVYVVKGDVKHVDYSADADPNDFLKSFLDYFLLTKAMKIFSVVLGDMYDSGFPHRASLHQNIPFEKITDKVLSKF